MGLKPLIGVAGAQPPAALDLPGVFRGQVLPEDQDTGREVVCDPRPILGVTDPNLQMAAAHDYKKEHVVKQGS